MRASNKGGRADGELQVFVSCFGMVTSLVIRAAAHLTRWNAMRPLHFLAVCALLLTGCSSPEPARKSAHTGDAVADLNRQIEKFNGERPADMGITPIAQRVSRAEYVPARDIVKCFDENGALLLVLSRQPDGRFKGSLKTKYHELPKPEGHSWGEVVAEFTLPQEAFQPKD